MTNEEIIADCKRFTDYLVARGVEVRGHLLFIGDQVFYRGDASAIDRAVLVVATELRGYRLEPK